MKVVSSIWSTSGLVALAFTLSLLVSFIDALAITRHLDRYLDTNDDASSPFGAGADDTDEQSISFPMIYKWSKRNPSVHNGCSDPTEPFQCPGSNICISLQFLCDGHAGDCPNNYDENQALCVSVKRPPKHAIMTLLAAQVNNHGLKFIEYLFGRKALALFSAVPHMEAINIITIALSVSPTIDEFANVIEMTVEEKTRLQNVLESLNNGQIKDLPAFITNSAGEGLSNLAHQLIKTHFLNSANDS